MSEIKVIAIHTLDDVIENDDGTFTGRVTVGPFPDRQSAQNNADFIHSIFRQAMEKAGIKPIEDIPTSDTIH